MTETKITDHKQKQILAKKFKSIEASLHLTAKELARLCGVSDTTIYRIEGRAKSDAAVSIRTLEGISDKIGVDIDWLLDFDQSAPSSPVWTSQPGQVRMSPVWMKKTEKTEKPGEEQGEQGNEQGTPADRLKELRNGMRMSQVEFAEHTGLTSGNLAGIETGRTRLTEATAKKIENTCEHGGAEWLLTGDERNKDYPINDSMIEWLKDHRRVRKQIFRMMEDEAEGEDVEAEAEIYLRF